MSQYVRVNCSVLENVKPQLAAKAVREMNGNLTLEPKMKFRDSIRHDLLNDATSIICRDGQPLNVGFKLVDNKLTIVGDFWRTGLKQKDFVDQFCFNYQKLAVQQMQKENNMTLLHKEVEADGTLVLRYAC